MVDLRYKDDALWKDSITTEEKAEIAKIDARVKALTKERKALTERRSAITNRCTVRTIARRGVE